MRICTISSCLRVSRENISAGILGIPYSCIVSTPDERVERDKREKKNRKANLSTGNGNGVNHLFLAGLPMLFKKKKLHIWAIFGVKVA